MAKSAFDLLSGLDFTTPEVINVENELVTTDSVSTGAPLTSVMSLDLSFPTENQVEIGICFQNIMLLLLLVMFNTVNFKNLSKFE